MTMVGGCLLLEACNMSVLVYDAPLTIEHLARLREQPKQIAALTADLP